MREGLRQTFLIARREAASLFGTPMFWVLSGVFFLASSFVYVGLIYAYASQPIRQANDVSADITLAVVRNLFWVIHFFLLIQVPLLTMRSLAEEHKEGTLSLLRTTPAGEWPIVLGKFVANTAVMTAYLGITFIFPIITEILSNPDWPVIAGCYLALFLSVSAYVGMGVFFSALTNSQIISAVLTYVGLFSFVILSGLSESFGSSSLSLLAQHLTIMAHMEGFLEGNLSLQDIAYFALFAFVFVFAAVRHLESLRWRN